MSKSKVKNLKKKYAKYAREAKRVSIETTKHLQSLSSEMAAGAISSIHEGVDIGQGRIGLMAGQLNGYLRVRVMQIDSGKKGRLKARPSVILKIELVSEKAPWLVELGESLCHQGDTISIVGPELRIPFKVELSVQH